jgi:hypothetical protein
MTDEKTETANKLTSAMGGLFEGLEAVGGVGGAMGKMKLSDRRAQMMNLKLTLILEAAGVDWKTDPRYLKMKAKWKADDGGQQDVPE